VKRYTLAIVCLSGWVVGPACQAIVGIEDRVEAPPDTDDGGGVTDGPAPVTEGGSDAGLDADGSCIGPDCTAPDATPKVGCETGCLPPAPAGWTGPVALYDGAESGKPADCTDAGAYTANKVETYFNLTAPAATCDCGTPKITGRKCTAGASSYTDPSCTMNGLKIANLTTELAACGVTSGDMGSFYRVSAGTLVPGTCTFPNATTTKPTKTYEKVQVACGQSQTTACATKPSECVTTPAPTAPFTRMCIHKDGDELCPSKDYPSRIVSFKSVDDQRACVACTATPTGGACGTKWGNQSSASSCADPLIAAPTDKTAATGCYSYGGSGVIIDIRPMAPSAGTCTPQGGTPTGQAKLIDPVTFCCTE
jgi:hypothetical protein